MEWGKILISGNSFLYLFAVHSIHLIRQWRHEIVKYLNICINLRSIIYFGVLLIDLPKDYLFLGRLLI